MSASALFVNVTSHGIGTSRLFTGRCLINSKQGYVLRILELMRFAIFVQLLFTGLPLNAQQASVSGVAINSITREPLSGAHITVSLIAKFPDPNQPYGATSGPDGRFSFPSLPAGVYQLSPRRNGFVMRPAYPPQLHLALGPNLRAGTGQALPRSAETHQ
jgi:Carboxypeptidase regulatory-like domain